MSDDNDSGGFIGTIISLLILAVIWPYLLTLLGLYIAYLAALATLEWIAQNPVTVVFILLVVTSICLIFRYRLIPKVWKRGLMCFRSKPVTFIPSGASAEENIAAPPNLSERKFIPSTNLYCYWCTRKLGIKAFEKNGKYYCDGCKEKM